MSSHRSLEQAEARKVSRSQTLQGWKGIAKGEHFPALAVRWTHKLYSSSKHHSW